MFVVVDRDKKIRKGAEVGEEVIISRKGLVTKVRWTGDYQRAEVVGEVLVKER